MSLCSKIRKPIRSKSKKKKAISKRTQDISFSLLIRERDGWKCRRCGAYHLSITENGHRVIIQCCHIFGKQAYPVTRFEPTNAFAGCSGCHRWAHDHPKEFYDWVKGWMGDEAFEALYQRALGQRKIDDQTGPNGGRQADGQVFVGEDSGRDRTNQR